MAGAFLKMCHSDNRRRRRNWMAFIDGMVQTFVSLVVEVPSPHAFVWRTVHDTQFRRHRESTCEAS